MASGRRSTPCSTHANGGEDERSLDREEMRFLVERSEDAGTFEVVVPQCAQTSPPTMVWTGADLARFLFCSDDRSILRRAWDGV